MHNLLDLTGIGRDRLHLYWISSAEAQRFQEIATRVTESIKGQGRFDSEGFALQLAAAEMTVESESIRWIVGKENKITAQGDIYGRAWDVEKYEAVLDSTLEREYHKNLIYLAVKEGFTSVRDIASRTGLELLRISYLLADLEKKSMVEFAGIKDRKPVFAPLAA